MFSSIAFADDAVGLELVTEPFIENLIATIVQHLEKSIVAKNPCCCHLNDTNNDNLHSKCEKDHHSESLMINSTDAIDNNIIIESVTVVNESNKNINSTTSVDNSFINVSDIEKAININTDIMNINRPVVSSCISLTSSDKCNLSDICRQLVEPSAQLESIVDIEQLNLPKIPLSSSSSSKEGKPYSSFIYSQKNLGQLPFYSYDEISTISMKNFLTNKLNNADSTLNIGQVSLSKILCK